MIFTSHLFQVKKVEVYEEEYEELEDEEEDYIDSGDEYIPTPFQKRTKRKMVRQSSKVGMFH